MLGDKWTAVTVDGSYSAHFEHCVAVTKQRADDFDAIAAVALALAKGIDES